jgi:hypothetical protein
MAGADVGDPSPDSFEDVDVDVAEIYDILDEDDEGDDDYDSRGQKDGRDREAPIVSRGMRGMRVEDGEALALHNSHYSHTSFLWYV